MKKGRSFAGTMVLLAVVSAGVTAVNAYTVITRDGHRFEVVEKPEIKGTQAYMKLYPHGQFASIKEEQIDWTRTELANGEKPIAIRATDKIVEAPAETPQPRVFTIVGEREDPKPTMEIEKKVASGDTEGENDAEAMDLSGLPELRKELAKEEARAAQQQKTLADLRGELERYENQGITPAGNSQEAGQVRDLMEMINAVEGNLKTTQAGIETLKQKIAELEARPGE